MAIYTKKGDKGKTGLYCNGQISKDSLVIDAIGAVDELNSYLGVVVSVSENLELKKTLKEIQKDLLTIGSILSGSNLRFSKSKTGKLEKIIDEVEKRLPNLKHFIIPGGSKVASHLHYARALSRRAERVVVALSAQAGLSKKGKMKPQILTYLNRLSDLFFILAREANFRMGVGEEVWMGKEKRKKL